MYHSRLYPWAGSVPSSLPQALGKSHTLLPEPVPFFVTTEFDRMLSSHLVYCIPYTSFDHGWTTVHVPHSALDISAPYTSRRAVGNRSHSSHVHLTQSHRKWQQTHTRPRHRFWTTESISWRGTRKSIPLPGEFSRSLVPSYLWFG